MPITPLHMLPAWCAKEISPDSRWSLEAFCLTQMAIDAEPLYGLLVYGDTPHAVFHTWSGAMLCATLVAAVLSARRHPPLFALLGALLGAVTHITLDAVMHPDVAAFGVHGLYGLLDLDTLHRVLFATGAVAAGLAAVRSMRMPTNNNLS